MEHGENYCHPVTWEWRSVSAFVGEVYDGAFGVVWNPGVVFRLP
jgi:hypothetical protein